MARSWTALLKATMAIRVAQLIAGLFLVGLTALCLVAGYAIGDMSIPLISVGLLAGISISIASLWFWRQVKSLRRKTIAA
jgi:ABC-type thiamin/hydroxymethylpyrimidine transport system permease subunit